MDVWLKSAEGSPFIGRVWPGNTVFVDFMNPTSSEYWKISIEEFLSVVDVDGIFFIYFTSFFLVKKTTTTIFRSL